MAILIDNQQAKHPIATQQIQKRTKAILNALGSPDDELSVVLVDDAAIAEINEHYLNHQGPTNVISFSMREGQFGDINPQMIGDVIISMDTCVQEAQEGDISIEQRFYELLIHGILHLFGYDHLKSEEEARIMDDKSRELMEVIGTVD